MPTRGRSEFARLAVGVFLSQTYERKELYILDDSSKLSFPDPSILNDARIHYSRQDGGNIPQKRNALTRMVQGDVIVNIDSDDWSAPERIAIQVERLQSTGLAVTGFNWMYFYDTRSSEAAVYGPRRHYVLGSSLCFRREWALAHPFPEGKRVGSDNQFIYAAGRHRQLDGDFNGAGLMVARMHDDNSSPKRTSMFKRVPLSELPSAFVTK